jgi:hypothetical protein
LEITKTVLSLMLVVITILTTLTLTTTIAAYAGDDDNGGDGNRQKAEDDSSAAIADCDDNEVERAGFDCIAIAANDVEIEPPEEESATLSVCKAILPGSDSDLEPEDFDFTVTDSNGETFTFVGVPPPTCQDVPVAPGEYDVVEEAAQINFATRLQSDSDCVQDPADARRATGEIQSGETQECTFINASAP